MPEALRPVDAPLTRDTPLLGLGATLAALSVLIYLLAPRAAPFLLLAMAAPALAATWPLRGTDASDHRALRAALLAFGGYLLVNSLWALDRTEAFGAALLYAAIAAALVLAASGLKRLPASHLTSMMRIAAILAFIGLVYLLIEEAARHPIKRTVFNWLPFLRPSEKRMAVEDGIVTNVYLEVSNRSIAALMFTLWPALLWLARNKAGERAWSRALLIALLAGSTVAVALSQHETSAIALVLAGLALGMCMLSRQLAFALVAIGWIASTLLVVPMVAQAYAQQMHMAHWLPKTARQRIIIWGYTAEQIAKAPWLGIGIGSGKVLDARHQYETPPGHVYPRRAGTHSHNVYLQTWYELGAIGAALLCALGLALLAAMRRLQPEHQPYALATFVSAAVIAAFSWGMWQPWFMASFGIAAYLLLAAAEAVRRREP